MSGYTPTGPFTNGSAPGIAAAFLNNLEAFIQQFEADTGATTINGGTNGTATCYQILQGTVKICYINCQAFRTGGSNQDWTLPTAFTAGCMFWCTDVNDFTFRSGGSASNIDVLTAIASGGGTLTSIGTVSKNSQGAYVHAIDTIRFASGAGSNHTGFIFIVGI